MPAENETNGNESRQAITAFEQILEVMPNDLFALEALHDAYLENGETEAAFKHLKHIAELVKNERDIEILTRISDKMLFLGSEFPAANELASDLQNRARELGGQIETETDVAQAEPEEFAPGINAEIALAWKLFESEQISKEDYTNITNDLTEMSSKDIDVPISVIHVLYDRGLNNTEKIISHISQKGHAPMISLNNFEIQMPAVQTLPLKFITKLGALPFDFIGDDLMVAVLNPFDKDLQKKVCERSRRDCHFYLVSAPEYDNALAAIRNAAKAEESEP